MHSSALTRRASRWLPLLALVLVSAPAAPGPADARTGGNLSVASTRYYAGQQLAFKGTTGQPGRRRLTLQSHMNRPGDHWDDIETFSAMTRDDGSFSFGYPGPAMGGISYRVVVGSVATPPVTFSPAHQEVLLRTRSEDPSGAVVAGEPMTVRVDTAAGGIALPGRAVTVQVRTGRTGWDDVATGAADEDGVAELAVTAPDGGTAVYRARAENWTGGGDQVGWFPSFPLYVDVVRRPTAASSLTAARVAHDAVDLTWVMPQDGSIGEAVVVRGPGSATPDWQGRGRARLDPDRTSYTDDVAAGRTYTYAVYTVNRRGVASPASKPVTVTTPAAPVDEEGRS